MGLQGAHAGRVSRSCTQHVLFGALRMQKTKGIQALEGPLFIGERFVETENHETLW